MTSIGPVQRIRRPEYTGENRCLPCTILNVIIAVTVSSLAALILVQAGISAPVATAIGLFVFGVAGALIFFRGYLIPGTPSITSRYFPDWILRHFDSHKSVPTTDGEVDVERILVGAGVVTECDDGTDLCLTTSFTERWTTKMDELSEQSISRKIMADLLDIPSETLEFENHGEAFVATVDGERIAQWESHAAFLGDVAASSLLGEHSDIWAELSIQERGDVLAAMRIFLPECPECSGAVTTDSEVVKSCCRLIDVVATTCDTCGARLMEVEYQAGAM